CRFLRMALRPVSPRATRWSCATPIQHGAHTLVAPVTSRHDPTHKPPPGMLELRTTRRKASEHAIPRCNATGCAISSPQWARRSRLILQAALLSPAPYLHSSILDMRPSRGRVLAGIA